METTISIRKDSPGYPVVEKCLQAIAKADYSAITRADIDAALDVMAKSIAEEHAIPFAEAYTATVTSETGKSLYNAREECPAVGNGTVVKRDDEAIAKAAEQARDAERLSKSYGIPIEDARAQVADFYANQK